MHTAKVPEVVHLYLFLFFIFCGCSVQTMATDNDFTGLIHSSLPPTGW